MAKPPASANFDRLARGYPALERLAFGRDLERARFRHLDRLRDCRDILLLGDGDGRCLARLVGIAPEARIHSVDSSPAMLARAAARIGPADARSRVRFEAADARSVRLPADRYDAVVTFFFLDCFRPEEVAELVPRVAASLRPAARWLYADFALPPAGWARWRARLWLAVLYAFFRWQTKITARRLPPSEDIIERTGFRREALCEFQGGLVRSVLFKRK